MTINPLLSQWDSNEQVKRAQGRENLGRWLRDSEGPQQARVYEWQARWWAAAVTLGGVLGLVLVLLI
jgi:hypothetical protein